MPERRKSYVIERTQNNKTWKIETNNNTSICFNPKQKEVRNHEKKKIIQVIEEEQNNDRENSCFKNIVGHTIQTHIDDYMFNIGFSFFLDGFNVIVLNFSLSWTIIFEIWFLRILTLCLTVYVTAFVLG